MPAKDGNGESACSWEYCLQWIDAVEPFFVCILGQRYGWVPGPEQLRAREDNQPLLGPPEFSKEMVEPFGSLNQNPPIP